MGPDQGGGKGRRPHGKSGKGPAAGAARGALSGVSAGLPALARALKLQQKASKVGFDWNSAQAVIDKIREETGEIEAELGQRRRRKAQGRGRRSKRSS